VSHQTIETAHVIEHAHPGSGTYIRVAIALAIITSIEVAIFYIHLNHLLFISLLLVLSAVKFAMVAAMFMHLKFDPPLFTFFFGGGLALAAWLIVALMFLLPNAGVASYVGPQAAAAAEGAPSAQPTPHTGE